MDRRRRTKESNGLPTVISPLRLCLYPFTPKGYGMIAYGEGVRQRRRICSFFLSFFLLPKVIQRRFKGDPLLSFAKGNPKAITPKGQRRCTGDPKAILCFLLPKAIQRRSPRAPVPRRGTCIGVKAKGYGVRQRKSKIRRIFDS